MTDEPYTKTFDLPEQPCPACGKLLDAANGEDNVAPEPGNLTVCIHCAAILEFDAGLKLLPLSPDEIAGLPARERAELFRVQAAIMEVQSRAGNPE